MKQYFEVGEEVILCSAVCPELNGDAVIEDARPNPPGTMRQTVDGPRRAAAPIYSYMVHSRWFAQKALRKKYPPSEESFSEMMSKIKATEKSV